MNISHFRFILFNLKIFGEIITTNEKTSLTYLISDITLNLIQTLILTFKTAKPMQIKLCRSDMNIMYPTVGLFLVTYLPVCIHFLP